MKIKQFHSFYVAFWPKNIKLDTSGNCQLVEKEAKCVLFILIWYFSAFFEPTEMLFLSQMFKLWKLDFYWNRSSGRVTLICARLMLRFALMSWWLKFTQAVVYTTKTWSSEMQTYKLNGSLLMKTEGIWPLTFPGGSEPQLVQRFHSCWSPAPCPPSPPPAGYNGPVQTDQHSGS